MNIRRALPEEAATLSRIALSAKAYWGYPERWMEIWTSLLTITPEFISSADVWVAEVNGGLAGFYALIFVKQRASLEHLWICLLVWGRGLDGRCSNMRWRDAAKCSVRDWKSYPTPTPRAFMSAWERKRLDLV